MYVHTYIHSYIRIEYIKTKEQRDEDSFLNDTGTYWYGTVTGTVRYTSESSRTIAMHENRTNMRTNKKKLFCITIFCFCFFKEDVYSG